MKFGLENSDIVKIIDATAQFSEIKQISIFGSRAKGTHLKGSDIDLAIKGDKVSDDTVRCLSFRLNEELPLTYFFEVVHYETIENKNLKDHIDRVGQKL